MPSETIQLNPFQERLLAIPELALLALRHVEQYRQQARILYLRKSYRSLADFELVLREVFGMVYGTAARYNAAENVWRFPNGGYMELGQLESQLHSAYG